MNDIFESSLELVNIKPNTKGTLCLTKTQFGIIIDAGGSRLKINPWVSFLLLRGGYNYLQLRKNPYTGDLLLVFSKARENDNCMTVRRKTDTGRYGQSAYVYNNVLCEYLYKYINNASDVPSAHKGAFEISDNLSEIDDYVTILVKKADKEHKFSIRNYNK